MSSNQSPQKGHAAKSGGKMLEESLADRWISRCVAHPYLWMLGICLFVHPFFLGSVHNIPANALWLEEFLLFALVSFVLVTLYRKGILEKYAVVGVFCLFLVLNFMLLKGYAASEHRALWFLTGGITFLTAAYFCLRNRVQDRECLQIILIVGLSFFVKLFYILITSIGTRQHDVGTFGVLRGHAGYIEYILAAKALPDFDPRLIWQFAHPPLHHILSAMWIYLNETLLLTGADPARESIQTLTLFYSMSVTISAVKIFRHFHLRGRALQIALLFVAFHPTFILFSGSINNDILSVALSLGAIACALDWLDKPVLSRILPVALCIGLSMMAKLMASLVAVPVAILFLLTLIRGWKKERNKLLLQFVCFALIVFPLGLGFQVRNYLRWNVPPTYVHEMYPDGLQYLGEMNFRDRVTDFSLYQFRSVYEQWITTDDAGVRHGYSEFNPLITVLKNEMFGEYINEATFGNKMYVDLFSTILFWMNALFLLLSVCAMANEILRRRDPCLTEKCALAAYFILLFASIYKMAARYPFTCTMNSRYISQVLIVEALFLGLFAQERGKASSSKAIRGGASFLGLFPRKRGKTHTEDAAQNAHTLQTESETASPYEQARNALFYAMVFFACLVTIVYAHLPQT